MGESQLFLVTDQMGAFINKVGAALDSRLAHAAARLLVDLAASIQSAFDSGHNL